MIRMKIGRMLSGFLCLGVLSLYPESLLREKFNDLLYPEVQVSNISMSPDGGYISLLENIDGKQALVTYDSDFNRKVIPQKENSYYIRPRMVGPGILTFTHDKWIANEDPAAMSTHRKESTPYLIDLNEPGRVVPGYDFIAANKYNRSHFLSDG